MFDSAKHLMIEGVDGISIHTVTIGQGAPLLLLHGHPETYLMWHKVVDELARHFTVVACDLRGYGDSDKPEGYPDHSNYSKRTMACDCIAVMNELGFEKFSVMGHDRGARVAYRMALDHPEVVDKLVLLDIVSTFDMYDLSSAEFAKALFHWYLLTQDAPFPEDLIISSRKMYFRNALHIGRYHSENDTSAEAFPPEVYEDYLRHYDVACIHAICEEYRAGEAIDRIHDALDIAKGKKIDAPCLVLWGKYGLVEKFFDPIIAWAKFCTNYSGKALECGHFIPEENPKALLGALGEFLW
ncbi:MAG: alpha/beta fold hydrolase [Eggerthellaceae bacterium]